MIRPRKKIKKKTFLPIAEGRNGLCTDGCRVFPGALDALTTMYKLLASLIISDAII